MWQSTSTQVVAVLTLNRPEHLNAYTAEMGTLLSRAYRDCDDDDHVRVIVVTGAGRAFLRRSGFLGQRIAVSTPRPTMARSPRRRSIRPPSNCASR